MSEATLHNPKESIVGHIQMGGQLLQKDLGAMDDAMLSSCPGGKARCGFDLVYEMSLLNRMIASQLRGETNDIPSPSGWVRAPGEFQNKERAAKELSDSVDELLKAFDGVSEDQLAKEVETPLGKMPISSVMGIMGSHLMYHSGQLNYIQTIHGDDAFHWA